MALFTENELRASSRRFEFSSSVRRNIKSFRSLATRSIFLSHSHKDKELVKGLIQKLAELGISLYVDWKDASMPPSPNKETAEQIKKKIGENDFFMLLATRNALGSKWVPWELGVADQKKGYNRIIVVPVTRNGSYTGNEYIQVYRRLDKGTLNSIAILEPGRSYGTSAKSFFG